MAIDSRIRRSSAICPALPWRGLWPAPDGALSGSDRRTLDGLYALLAGRDSQSAQSVAFKAGRVYRVSGWLKHGGTTGSGAGVGLMVLPAGGQTLTVLERQGTAMDGSTPSVGIPSGAAVGDTFVQTLFTPNIDGVGTVAPSFGIGGSLIGEAWFNEVRCEELPVDTTIGGKRAYAGIDGNGSLYVPSGQGINVGAQGSPSSKSKTVRYSFARFTAQDPSVLTLAFYSSFVSYYEVAGGVKATDLRADFFFPKGVTLTAFRSSMNRGTSGETAVMKLYRAGTSLALNTHTAFGDSTVTSSISQLVGDEHYTVVGNIACGGAASQARFYWIEFDYTMPKYENSY